MKKIRMKVAILMVCVMTSVFGLTALAVRIDYGIQKCDVCKRQLTERAISSGSWTTTHKVSNNQTCTVSHTQADIVRECLTGGHGVKRRIESGGNGGLFSAKLPL